MTPRPDPGSAGSPLAVLRTAIRNCDIHGIPDCSPLLNGCSRVNHNHAALARVEAVIEAARTKRRHDHDMPVLLGDERTYQDWASENRFLGAAVDAALAALDEGEET